MNNWLRVALSALLSITVVGRPGHGQLPGLPVLQNAFVAPGLAAAVNAGGGSGATAYAAAVAWAPRSARFQISVGGGVHVAEGETGGAFGARAAVPIFSRLDGRLGFAAFAGVGGAQGPKLEPDGRVGLGFAPIGLAVGYRRALGARRGFSIYAAPYFGFFRTDTGNDTESKGLFRASIGGDFAVTRALGVTAGIETGASASDDAPGPSGLAWGIGVSYAFGRR